MTEQMTGAEMVIEALADQGVQHILANLGAALTLPQPAGPPAASPQSNAAERRQLTVMFCDLVGSTLARSPP